MPQRKLASCARSRRRRWTARSTASACARSAATQPWRSPSACPASGPFTAQGIVVRGAGEPDHLATAEPRMARAAALAYGLDAPCPPTSSPAAPRPGAHTAHGSACCCGSPWRTRRTARAEASSPTARACARPRAGAERPRGRAVHARADAERPRPPSRRPRRPLPWSCRPDSRGGRDNLSRKVRTPQGKVVGRPTRGNPRESATETHRRWRGLCRAPHRQG